QDFGWPSPHSHYDLPCGLRVRLGGALPIYAGGNSLAFPGREQSDDGTGFRRIRRAVRRAILVSDQRRTGPARQGKDARRGGRDCQCDIDLLLAAMEHFHMRGGLTGDLIWNLNIDLALLDIE